MKLSITLLSLLLLSAPSCSLCYADPPTTQECQDAYHEKVALLPQMNQRGIHLSECIVNVNATKASLDFFWQAHFVRLALQDLDGAQEILVAITILQGQLATLQGLQFDMTIELNSMQIRLNQLNAILGEC
jgi:hypothetical protein